MRTHETYLSFPASEEREREGEGEGKEHVPRSLSDGRENNANFLTRANLFWSHYDNIWDFLEGKRDRLQKNPVKYP